METTYHIEHSKSGRASCKKCKEKIGKDELRIGVNAPGPGDYTMTSWCHPKCFTIPRKLQKDYDAVSFVEELLEDQTNGFDKDEVMEAIAASKKGAAAGGSKAAQSPAHNKISIIKKNLETIRAADDEDAPPKKKMKLTENENKEARTYEIYQKCTNDELKDYLRWNRQLVSGPKDILLQRVIDGHMNGRLGKCPMCTKGKLKLKDEDGETVACLGWFDEENSFRHSCLYQCSKVEAPRFQPWYQNRPTDEEDEIMDKEYDAEGTPDTVTSTSETDTRVTKLQALASALDWDLRSNPGIKAAAKSMQALCTQHKHKLDLPSDEKKAVTDIGKMLLQNRDKSAEDIVLILSKQFSFVQDKAEAKAREEKAGASICTCAENAPVMLAINELSELYFKEGNTNAGGTYRKVAKAIQGLNFAITEKNAKGLAKPKTKVEGIGKGSADKIYEFVTTGTMEKLEEKRASA